MLSKSQAVNKTLNVSFSAFPQTVFKILENITAYYNRKKMINIIDAWQWLRTMNFENFDSEIACRSYFFKLWCFLTDKLSEIDPLVSLNGNKRFSVIRSYIYFEIPVLILRGRKENDTERDENPRCHSWLNSAHTTVRCNDRCSVFITNIQFYKAGMNMCWILKLDANSFWQLFLNSDLQEW